MNSPLTDAFASALSTQQTTQYTSTLPRHLEARSQTSVDSAVPIPPSQAAKDKNSANPTELTTSIQRINTVMSQRGLEFEIHQESDRVVTRVIDRDSGDVIRQIPAEEVLRLAERLDELQQGRLISLKV